MSYKMLQALLFCLWPSDAKWYEAMQNMSATGRLPSNSTCLADHPQAQRHRTVSCRIMCARARLWVSCTMPAFFVCLVPAERC